MLGQDEEGVLMSCSTEQESGPHCSWSDQVFSFKAEETVNSFHPHLLSRLIMKKWFLLTVNFWLAPSDAVWYLSSKLCSKAILWTDEGKGGGEM